MSQIGLKWEIQRLQGTLPNKITNPCTFYEDNLYLIVDNYKLNDLYSLSLIDFKWRRLYNGIPFKARYNSQFVMNQGKLYCYGGSIDIEGTILLDEFLEIDVVQLKFRQIKSAPTGRVEHSMCMYRGQVLIIGGRTQKKIFNDCKTYTIGSDKWNQIEFEPTHRFGHQCTVYEDTIIITGGSDGQIILDDVWLLVDLRTWIRLEIKNPLQIFRHQAVLAMKEYLIIFGGCTLDGKRCNDNFYALNIVTLKWIELPKVSRHPYPRVQHTMLCLLNQSREDILVIGGLNYQDLSILNFSQMANLVDLQPQSSLMSYRSHTVEREEFLQDIPFEVQNIEEGTSFLELGKYYEWKIETNQEIKFTPRTGHSVVQCQENLYLFCGSDDTTIVNDMHSYNLFKKQWEQITSKGIPPSPRSGCKGVAHQHDIYYFGGYTNRRGEYFNDLYVFDTKLRQWNQIRTTREIQPRVDMSLVINNEKLYVFGGADGSNRFNDLHCFDIQNNQWIKLQTHGQVPSPRFGHTAEVYKNQMYLFGGWDGFKTLDELYTYSFASNYWYLEKVRNKPPSRYRHSSTIIGYSIYIFGGVDAAMTRFNDLYEYNCELKEWKFIETAGNTPSARTFHQLCSYETTIYLIGGNDGTKKNNDMYSIQVFDHRFSDLSSISQLEIQSTIIPKENGLISILKNQVNELEQRLKEEQEFNLCQICQSKDINSVFLECGHRFCCYECSNKLELCKICLKKPNRIIKIYVV
ncbi:unnamed protein product [Paramecium sonneborni]|uniref:RING-type domain-containing protein n=1 Tax=Paramecium sonneborni TaxID=65129 RepID=A0A8S1LVX1_9CILI|nr:unnamed protein product [Paramecium sonneborni]